MDAIDRAVADYAAYLERKAARQAIIDADPRIVWLQGQRRTNGQMGEGMIGAGQIFLSMANGDMARDARIVRLIRARIHQIDKAHVAVQRNLGEAARARRTHWSVAEAAL